MGRRPDPIKLSDQFRIELSEIISTNFPFMISSQNLNLRLKVDFKFMVKVDFKVFYLNLFSIFRSLKLRQRI